VDQILNGFNRFDGLKHKTVGEVIVQDAAHGDCDRIGSDDRQADDAHEQRHGHDVAGE
jgi:hypothetical protein